MNNQPNFNHPFFKWIPRPIGVIILLLMFIPPTLSGGAYICNINEMSGFLGFRTEDIQLASFFTSIGMCLFPPFMLRFLQTRRVKQTYLWCFGLLIPLNYICATTSSVVILCIACLLIGFVRIIVMLNCTFTIAPYLTGMDTLAMFTLTDDLSAEVQYAIERKRTFLMPILYFYILLISQTSNVLMACTAYNYHWQDAYYVAIGLSLIAMLLVFCSMPDEERRTDSYKIEWNKIPEMLLMTIALCSMTCILVYGKTLDWFDSHWLRIALALLLVSTGLFISVTSRKTTAHYLPLNVFSYRNIWISMLLFLLTMMFNSASMFFGTFAKLSTTINNLQSSYLSGWAAIGCLFGLILSIILIIKRVHFRTVFCIGFLLMASANGYMYFQYQTSGLFDNMILPTILNYTGLLILYSLIAAFGMKKIPTRYLVTFVFLMIWMRNAIAPVIGSSLYTNWINERQQYYISRLSHEIDRENHALSQFINTDKLLGKSEMLLTATLKKSVSLQATIVAMKNITGQTTILLLSTIGIVLLLPYHKNETT